jgi:hypothetical protein
VSAEETYVATRRQLRAVAESLIAGPQYRASGTIRLAVRPGGFTGVTIPLSVQGTELVWPNARTALAGTAQALAESAGVDLGPPDGVYPIVDPLSPDTVIDLDPAAADFVYRSHYAGGHAIKQVLPEQHPVLWPEHFDVAATEGEVNFGVSAGDDFHPMPYAYVGPWNVSDLSAGDFWNAPFGALTPLDPAHDMDILSEKIVDFFERGRRELR